MFNYQYTSKVEIFKRLNPHYIITKAKQGVRDFIEDVRQHGLVRRYEGMSVEEIAARMTPVPEEQLRDRLPTEFAKTLREIFNRN